MTYYLYLKGKKIIMSKREALKEKFMDFIDKHGDDVALGIWFLDAGLVGFMITKYIRK